MLRPLTARFTKHQANRTQAFVMFDTVTPVSARQSLAWVILAFNYGRDTPESVVRAFQDKITAQDRPIVESQRPELHPLDLRAELHLRSDRTAIAYRQWLRALGVKYGTA